MFLLLKLIFIQNMLVHFLANKPQSEFQCSRFYQFTSLMWEWQTFRSSCTSIIYYHFNNFRLEVLGNNGFMSLFSQKSWCNYFSWICVCTSSGSSWEAAHILSEPGVELWLNKPFSFVQISRLGSSSFSSLSLDLALHLPPGLST